MLQRVAVCLLLPSAALGFQLPTRGVSFRTNRIVLSSADDGDADERSAEAKAEDDALAAAFNARLQKEGGATQFKIKSSLNSAAESVKDAIPKAPDLPSVSAGDVLNAPPQVLLGGLFGIVVLFTVVSAGLNSGPSDMSTSDGTTLEFGKRSMEREVPLNPYKAQYGSQ